MQEEPPTITSPVTAQAELGTAFTYQIVATNEPDVYDATGLPAGLKFDYDRGLISGTPTKQETCQIELAASNMYGTGKAVLTLVIGEALRKKGVIDIDHPYKGRVGDDELAKKYKGVLIGYNGDYKVPIDLRAAVEKAGEQLLQYAKDNNINLADYGFDINSDGKVGVQEAGSGCMALALEHGRKDVRGKKDQIVSIFDTGNFEIMRPLKGEDWRAAEQVLGDNWPNQVKKPTNTAEADKAFISRYSSGNDGLIR